MDIERKTFNLEIKELNEEGHFKGYLSTFGNVDQGGDIVDAGAFKRTLKNQKTFPLTWAHDASTPDLVIGTFSGEEDEKGLLIDGEFFLDLDGGEKAYKTAKKLFAKKIKMGLSMGYKTMKYTNETVEGMMIRRLKEVKLQEGALTLFPMNEEARVESIKGEGDEHNGTFEAASKKEALIITCTSCGETIEVDPEEVSTQLKSFYKNTDPDNEFHSVLKKIAENLKSSMEEKIE